jgi:hypothetical protein
MAIGQQFQGEEEPDLGAIRRPRDREAQAPVDIIATLEKLSKYQGTCETSTRGELNVARVIHVLSLFGLGSDAGSELPQIHDRIRRGRSLLMSGG